MKCFYCGRPYTEETNDEGKIRLICKFPRCKLQPATDYHDSFLDCYDDVELIKESWRNSK